MTETERELRAKQQNIVINEFRDSGRVDANLMWRRHGISRTAAIIWRLRQVWGADAIVTDREPGEMAVYRLVRPPETWVIPRKPRRKRGWLCNVCGSRTLMVDDRISPTLGRSRCDTCAAVRMFRLF